LRRVFLYIQHGIPNVPTAVQLGFLASCPNRTLGTLLADSLTFCFPGRLFHLVLQESFIVIFPEEHCRKLKAFFEK